MLPLVKYVTHRVPLVMILSLALISCNKFLDKKSDERLAVPNTPAEIQALIDMPSLSVRGTSLPELVSDNVYIPFTNWSSLNVQERKSYTWDADAKPVDDQAWRTSYEGIYYANFILDQLPSVNFAPGEAALRDRFRGQALFFRGFFLHQLAEVFCKPYSSSASGDLGLVLRPNSGVAAPSVRATLQETYDRILSDLKEAVTLLPLTEAYNTRPVRAAGYAALARAYLSMRDYPNARLAAEACLALTDKLLDYNKITTMPSFLANPEVLFMGGGFGPTDALRAGFIDTTLYASYQADDLRKTLFFSVVAGGVIFKGSYLPDNATWQLLVAPATDEMYLVAAECAARAGERDAAMNRLNKLLKTRWKTGTFTDLVAATPADALNTILAERRKELVWRATRWSDIRRLNEEGANLTLKRILNNQTFTLPPKDLRWALLIPDVEIQRSGIPQNPR